MNTISLYKIPPKIGAITSEDACIAVTIPFALSISFLSTREGILAFSAGVYIVLMIDSIIIVMLIMEAADFSMDISRNKHRMMKLLVISYITIRCALLNRSAIAPPKGMSRRES